MVDIIFHLDDNDVGGLVVDSLRFLAEWSDNCGVEVLRNSLEKEGWPGAAVAMVSSRSERGSES